MPLNKYYSVIGISVMVIAVIITAIITTEYYNNYDLIVNGDCSITEHRHVTLRNWLIDKIYIALNKNEHGLSYNKSFKNNANLPDRVSNTIREIGIENSGVKYGTCNKDRNIHVFLIQCGNNKIFNVYFDKNWGNAKVWKVY